MDDHPGRMWEHAIACPKCQGEMRKLKVEDAVVERCERCYGIWLDAGERLKIFARAKTAGVVDVGPRDRGKEHDAIRAIKCPVCGVPMVSIRHPDQTHIQFEECAECGGTYFDAGELEDLSQLTISDLVKRLLGLLGLG